MNAMDLLEILGEADDGQIRDAKAHRPLPHWIPWLVGAACLAVCLYLGFGILNRSPTPSLSTDSYIHNYKNAIITGSEVQIDWPWEYRTTTERYHSLRFQDVAYQSRGRAIDAALLGEALGTGKAEGYDEHTQTAHALECTLYRIEGVSEDVLLAAELEDACYVFAREGYDPPTALGQFLELYNLTQTLPLEAFTRYENGKAQGCFRLESDDPIWEILADCQNAVFVEDQEWSPSGRNYISFTATSEALGIYKRVLYVTEDGYLSTNIFDYGYLFDIGEEAANRILRYAEAHSVETDPEPYLQSLAGTLVEIGDGYLLVDDTALCVDEKDGTMFQISTEALHIRRYVELGILQEGDTVFVSFTGPIDPNHVVNGVEFISKATISQGNVMIPE